MIKAQSIGKTIVAIIGTKMYNKEFATLEEKVKVYEKLLNLNEEVKEDVKQAIKLFESDLIGNEKQLQLEYEQKKSEASKYMDILDFMKKVRDNGHDIFDIKENSLVVKGLNISTPDLLIREIMKANGDTDEVSNPERLQALLNFWKLCSLNPDPRARFDLFKFLRNHDLTITPSGYFVAYRTVNVKKSGNSELEEFVTQQYLKVKRWKKAPKNYTIWKTNSEYLSSLNTPTETIKECVGNLADLYSNIGKLSGNIYTDAHTGTYSIKIGEPVQMDRSTIDPDPENSCSYGLHLGNVSFMRNNMGYFGKTGIVCLCNPKNVTAVPSYDLGKMRTCEYLPIAIAELDANSHIIPVKTDVFEYEYAQNTEEELKEMSKLSGYELEEYKKHVFIAPDIDLSSLRLIYESVTKSIELANQKIENRVIEI